jgi:3-hydroxyisobutyrate dehydrogenase-like beta-hydroxyacid dehydrogenase
VLLAVFDTKDVQAVLEAADGLLASGHRVRTVDRLLHRHARDPAGLAARLQRRGVAFIEGPLSGSSQQIAAGEATQLLGGDADAIARCDAGAEAIARQRIHVGAAGMAAKAKLATNLVLGLNRAVLAEGMAFARAWASRRGFLALVLATPARSAAAESQGADDGQRPLRAAIAHPPAPQGRGLMLERRAPPASRCRCPKPMRA